MLVILLFIRLHIPRLHHLAKIPDFAGGFWHRMGDLGYLDEKGRVWFCGRKSHRVVTKDRTLFTIPCEAIFNFHEKVFRSALVGVGRPGEQTPVLCVELEKGVSKTEHSRILEELKEMGSKNGTTQAIKEFRFHPEFPVDIRHNAKIFRVKLALWAEKAK